ncbi:MAG: heme o synthase [Myxococcota bacterium]|nr:heme o synthase [Myxococcota bacterium]
MSAVANYVALTKPRILPLVLFSGLPALMMAGQGWPTPALTTWTLIGTIFAAAAANALNSYLERDQDALMDRTRARPLPAGLVSPGGALAFALFLAFLGVGLLWLEAGVAPALIAVAAIGVYVFIYTLWLKPRTPFAVIVGGISGAIAPLIADAAVSGHIGVVGWTLFAIIFVWQPPHFYAIALFRRDDYARANFPMLPDRIGVDATLNRIVIWAVGLVAVTLLPFFLLGLGYLYLIVALVLGAICLQRAWRLRTRKDDASARGFFLFSLVHLLGCFSAMILDLALGAWL